MTKDSCYLENTTKERIMSLNSFEISKEKIFRQLISMQLFVQLIKQNKKNYNNNQKKKSNRSDCIIHVFLSPLTKIL